MERPYCSTDLQTGARFCSGCGKPVPPPASRPASQGDGDILNLRGTVVKAGTVFLGGEAAAAQMGGGECGICGKYNRRDRTFRCRGCGREFLCLRHQNPKLLICQECADQRREAEEQGSLIDREAAEPEQLAQPDGPRITAEEWGGLWLKPAAAAAALVALVFLATRLAPGGPTVNPVAAPSPIAAASRTATPVSAAAATPASAALDTARVRTLEAAAQANPNDKASRIELGNMCYDSERFTEAIGWYTKALELDPNDTAVRTDLATSYFYTGDATKAIEEGNKVLAIDPNQIPIRLNMGIWLTSLNPPKTAEALQHWLVVVKLYPGSVGAKQAQAFIDEYRPRP